MPPRDPFSLADYRRRVHESYSAVRSSGDLHDVWRQWRTSRDLLFRSHPQSPLPHADRNNFRGIPYSDYNPTFRIEAALEPTGGISTGIGHSGEGETRFTAVGIISLVQLGIDESLTVYWLEAYGGGLFLPFRDKTSGDTTYGGGRYLLDTVKGADLGGSEGRLVIDFNYAYHPSCAYNSQWSCPLAPEANWLSGPIDAGELLAESASRG